MDSSLFIRVARNKESIVKIADGNARAGGRHFGADGRVDLRGFQFMNMFFEGVKTSG